MKRLPHTAFRLIVAVCFLASLAAASAQVLISEFLADNQTNSVIDEDGSHPDWIELWNSGATPVSLNGWYLTDTSSDLRKWQFPVASPVVSLAANGRLLIFASNKNRKLLANRLHTNFKLAKNAGSYLALVRADGLTIEYSYSSYPQQVQDISYGIPSAGGAATYLVTATPSSPNSAGITALGPSISATTSNPPRPTGGASSASIIVTTKVVPTVRPLAVSNPVQLKYRVMFNSETTVTMKDDGIAPDSVAGDSIYTAQIGTTGLTAGQMLRWRIVAADNASVTSTDPPFRDTTDNDQYYGTIAADGITTSSLPILHWFISDADLATLNTDTFVRAQFFFLGKFYDNVRCDRHGQSTSGFPKKSYNFNFNQDNKFKWQTGQADIGAINLLTNWADKSKVRNQVAWETWNNTGHIASHWSQAVRMQRNGVFQATYDMTENGDEDFLTRESLDPLGALYKVYNSLENVNLSASDSNGVEKKTGYPLTDFNDLATLEAALDPATKTLANRRQYAYDNVNMSALINYMTVNVLILNNDFGHKNYYIYFDTNGTRQWSLLPWDQDLTFGHTWTSPQAYFNDDIDSQRGLVQGNASGNRLMNLVMNASGSSTLAPEMVQMFLRRLRSLMDQYLVSATATTGPFEQRMNQLVDLFDPPGAAYLTDADLDLQKWGYWTDGIGGQAEAGNTYDAATFDHGIRKSLLRIIDNVSHTGNPSPPYPASTSNAEGLGDTTNAFLTGRRKLLYTLNPTLNSTPIPAAQASLPSGLVIEYVEANPASGNQEQEFFIIRNNSSSFLDLSGWKITGAVDYTFPGGTVLPPFTSGGSYNSTADVHTGRLHVVRNPNLFRQRTTSPKGGEYRLLAGPYNRHLSARGETINLVKPGATPAQDAVLATTTYAGNPTPSQNFLRVTELNYDPAAPSPAESSALPGVRASDFEFIEFKNVGASPLNIGGAQITQGVSFTFPLNFTLQSGQRCVVASLVAGYNLRYAGAGALVAGQFEGNLDNGGETVQVTDGVGEIVLEFTYDSLWFGMPVANNPSQLAGATGYSLVVPSASPTWFDYDRPSTWALSDALGGTPGASDPSFSTVFAGWSKSFFTPSEEANLAYGGLTGDPDHDGRTNFEEFIFGGNPKVAEQRPLPVSSWASVDGLTYLAITFDRRHHTLDTTCVVEGSNDLTAWTVVDLPVGTPTALPDNMERVTYRDDHPYGTQPRFLRVRATR